VGECVCMYVRVCVKGGGMYRAAVEIEGQLDHISVLVPITHILERCIAFCHRLEAVVKVNDNFPQRQNVARDHLVVLQVLELYLLERYC